MSQCGRILEFLADGQPHEMRAIHDAVGFCRLNSRVSELRKRGHNIVCDPAGGRYVYQLLSSPEPALTEPEGVPAVRRTEENPSSGSVSVEPEQLTLVAA